MTQLNYFLRNLVLVTGFTAICACVSTSTVKSSGVPAPSTSSPPASQDGKSTGEKPSPSQTKTADDESSGKKQDNQGKSDDQILAEALEDLEKSNKGGQQDGAEQTVQTASAPAATSDHQGEGPLTDTEKSKELNKQLDEKFARFDDMILGERESAAKSANGSGSGKYDAEGTLGDGEGEGDDQDKSLQTAMADKKANSSAGGLPSDISADSTSAPPPADIGDGAEDDIIARQLREAAMKEKDPELRAKLWDEYRKYKKGLQAKR